MKLPATIDLIRPHNCLLAGLAVLAGAIVASQEMPLPIIIFAFAAAAAICAGGNAINDYCDRKIDAVNRPERPIPSGRISASRALSTGRYLFLIGVLFAAPLGLPCVLLAVLNSLVLALYSAELKRGGLIGNLAIGYLVGSTFLFGGLAVNKLQAVSILAAMAALSTIGRELVKDIQDMRGDRKSGLRTFPLLYGPKAAVILGTSFIAAAIVLSPLPFLLGLFGKTYLMLVIISAVLFVAACAIVARSQRPRAASEAALICKIGMGFGLLAFLVGAIM